MTIKEIVDEAIRLSRYPKNEAERMSDYSIKLWLTSKIKHLSREEQGKYDADIIRAEYFTLKACEAIKIDPELLKSKSRKPEAVMARAAIAKVLISKTNITLKDIGIILGRRHANMIYYRDGIKTCELLEKNIKIIQEIGL